MLKLYIATLQVYSYGMESGDLNEGLTYRCLLKLFVFAIILVLLIKKYISHSPQCCCSRRRRRCLHIETQVSIGT